MEADKTYRVVRYYRFLFTLSSLKVYFFIYSILSLLFALLLNLSPNISALILLSLVLFLPSLEFLLINALFPGNDFFTLRRVYVVGVVTLSSILFPLLPASLFLSHGYMLSSTLGLGLGIAIAFRIIIYTSLLRDSPVLRFLLSLWPLFIFLSIFSMAGAIDSLPSTLIPPFIFTIFTMIYLLKVDSAPMKLTKMGGLSLFRAYMRSWSLDDSRELDKVLEKSSTRQEVEVQALHLKTEEIEHVFFAPHFHFGPFRNSGSSAFPSLLKRVFYELRGLQGVVLHTPSSHAYDLATVEESLKVVDRLVQTSSTKPYSSTITPLIRQAYGEAQASALASGEYALLCLSYKEMEDIPMEVSDRLRNYARGLGFQDAIVVDAHNSLTGLKAVFTPENVEEIYKVGVLCLQELKEAPQYEFQAALTSHHPPDIGPDNGLGGGGINVFLWRVIGNLYALVIVDANNLSQGLRSEAIERLRRSMGVEAEILTTDTHEVTARRVVSRGYLMLGEEGTKEAFLSALNLACQDTTSRLSPSKIGYSTKKVEVKILGEKGLALLTSAVEVTFERARRYALICYASALALTLLSIIL